MTLMRARKTPAFNPQHPTFRCDCGATVWYPDTPCAACTRARQEAGLLLDPADWPKLDPSRFCRMHGKRLEDGLCETCHDAIPITEEERRAADRCRPELERLAREVRR